MKSRTEITLLLLRPKFNNWLGPPFQPFPGWLSGVIPLFLTSNFNQTWRFAAVELLGYFSKRCQGFWSLCQVFMLCLFLREYINWIQELPIEFLPPLDSIHSPGKAGDWCPKQRISSISWSYWPAMGKMERQFSAASAIMKVLYWTVVVQPSPLTINFGKWQNEIVDKK